MPRLASPMQESMASFNEENRVLGLPEVYMGIDLHAGTVVAGNIGSADRLKYGVVGPAVSLAARIQAVTAADQVLLSDAVLTQVASAVTVRTVGAVPLKGIVGPVILHELVGVVGQPVGGTESLPR